MVFQKLKIATLLFFFSTIVSRVNGQVDLSTGAAQFNLPIYAYSDLDKLSTNISLNYVDGNGLKANEVAGIVGTGWELKVGGVITRIQRGLPDDQKRATPYLNPLPANTLMTTDEYRSVFFPQGYLSSYYSPNDNITNYGGFLRKGVIPLGFNQPVDYSKVAPVDEFYSADREQDIFRLEYGNGTVEFVLEKNGTVTTLNNSKIKVEVFYENNLHLKIKTWIRKFVITDLSGIKYMFSEREIGEECIYEDMLSLTPTGGGYIDLSGGFNSYNLNTINNTNNPLTTVFKGKPIGVFVVNKWYLSEIINPLTNKKIIFSYETFNIDQHTQKIIEYFKAPSVRIIREVVKALRLTKIECPQQNVIDFVYDNVARADMPIIKPLKEIIVKSNYQQINKYVFDYKYFYRSETIGSTTSPQMIVDNNAIPLNKSYLSRLCLNSIKKFGVNNVNSENPYRFDYHIIDNTNLQTEQLRIPIMYSYFTDEWGYSNIDGEYPYIAYDDNGVSYLPSQQNLKIYSFSGAYSKKFIVPGLAKLGILKSVTNPLGGVFSFNYEQNDLFRNGQNELWGGVRVNKVVQFDGISHSNDIVKEFKYVKENSNSSSGWGFEEYTHQKNTDFRVYYSAQTNANITSGSSSFASTLITSNLQTIYGRSVFPPVTKNIKSTGLLSMAILVIQILNQIFSQSPPQFEDTLGIEYSSDSYQTANPLPFLYSRVEVNEKTNSGNNGKTVVEFTAEDYKPLLVPVLTQPFSNKARFLTSAYGLPSKVTVYDNTGFKIKETQNTYSTTDYLSGSLSKTWMSNKYFVDKYPVGIRPEYNQTDFINQETYSQVINFTELISTKENLFSKTNTNFTELITNYTYNPINHQLKSKSSYDSKNKLIETKYFYPVDYSPTLSSSLTTLVNNNMLNVPISTETWQTKVGGTPELLSNSIIEFGTTPNGDIKPAISYQLQSEIPLSQNVIGVFNPNELKRNTPLIKSINETIYDNKGYPVKVKDLQSDMSACTIFSEITAYPIATISNASPNEVAYSSFEETGESNGNISLTLGKLNDAFINQNTPTGKRSFNLFYDATDNSNWITVNVNTTKESILSFWATTTDVLINGIVQTPIIASPTIRGWTYYQYQIPIGTSGLSITGHAQLDEIRLYPKNAKMATSSFEIGKGKTSECDINNRITYYEYDGLQRVVKILDEKRNIIKTFEYNFKN